MIKLKLKRTHICLQIVVSLTLETEETDMPIVLVHTRPYHNHSDCSLFECLVYTFCCD